jgi:uncharacterized protein (DUF2267 family)
MSPGALTGLAALPALRARLQATLEAQVDLSVDLGLARASLQARLALTLDPLSLQPEAADDAASPLPPGLPPTRLARLDARHRALVTALRLRLNTLDTRRAQAAYTQLAAGLVRVLPPFLRQSRPLTLGDVRSGLAALRPSTQARRIDEAVDRFLARLAPLQTALDGSINGFFSEIRNTALVLHPGGLKDAVAEVYAALRDRLAVLDPDALAAQLRTEVWDPLMEPLRAIDPQAIGSELNALYRDLIATLEASVQGLLGQLRSAIDSFMQRVRQALAGLLSTLTTTLDAVLADVTALLARLDDLIVNQLFERLLALLDRLKTSFATELHRVRNEFDAMLAAIPLGSPSQAAVGVA